jgi:hypothetical protein
MELVNISLITVSSIIMIVWALRKRTEILTMNIEFAFDADDLMDKDTKDMKDKMDYMKQN